MVMISMPGGEARATPSYHSMGSPRYGGCVGRAFLHFLDWSPGKCFYSTKRLPANKPEVAGMRRSRSFRSDHGSTSRTRMMCDAQDAAVEEGSSHVSRIVPGTDDAKAPSVVARLMGLESLGPKSPYQHRRCQSYSGSELPFAFVSMEHDHPRDDDDGKQPVLLQDLLERDFKLGAAKKLTLRDRMPGFAKRAQEQYENYRFTKKAGDIPDTVQSQELGKQPFLSRLAPQSPAEVSIDGIIANPELSNLQAAGWPLAGAELERSHESFDDDVSFRSSLLESEISSASRNPKSAMSSKPALANVARKIFQGRRRGHESEDSESNSSQVETVPDLIIRGDPLLPLPHRKPGIRESALKKVVKSLSPPRHRNIRSIKSPADRHEASVREFKTRIPVTPMAAANSSQAADQARQPLIPSRSHSTDFAQDHIINSRTSSASRTSQTLNLPISSKTSTSRSKGARPGAKVSRNPQKVKSDTSTTVPSKVVISKPPPLDGYRAAPKVKDSQKHLGLPAKGSFPGYGKLLGARKAHKGGEQSVSMNLMETSSAPRFTDKQSTKINTLQGIQRVRETMLANTVITTPLGDRLKRDPEMATQSIVNSAPNDCYRKNVGKKARARSIDDVFPELPLEPMSSTELGGFSGSADLRGNNGDEVETPSCELLTEQVFHVDLQEFFAAELVDDLSWEEDETVEQRVNSPLSERSCSGPSISSVSVTVSDVDEERNGDDWSSCASYNPADCDSPRTFELPDTDADESDIHEPKSAPMFVKKIAEEIVADELAAGQPSPVSILNSPFHDEAGTTSDQYTDEDGNFKSSSTTSRSARDTGESIDPDSPSKIKYDDNDKIRQALLDISMFQCLEVFTFDYKEFSNPSGPKEEERFVRDVLSAANFMSTDPGASPNWFDHDVAIDPSLFDRLESGDINGEFAEESNKMFQISGGLWRCDRKLLFDCVNEAFAFTLWRSWCSEMGLQWYNSSRRPRGQKLVQEVYEKIEEWRKLAALSIDSLIVRDMGSQQLQYCGNWKDFSAEVAEVGLDIESMVWKAVVEEVVMDMVATSKRTSKSPP